MKPKSQKYWKNKCDALITKAGRNTVCAVCGRKPASYHHIISRVYGDCRHDIKRNLIPLCAFHHMFSNDLAPHSNNIQAVMAFVKWLRINYPKKYKFMRTFVPSNRTIDYESRYKQLKDKGYGERCLKKVK